MSLTLLDFYKAIEDTSARMLAAAHMADWDEVVRLEGACAVLIEQLRERGNGIDLSAEERAEKHRIMMTILRHDAQIRHLAEPFIEELGQQLGQTAPSQLH
ncbi:MAG: flagellar protein FliT [Serpentinimonas sp.]|jgi:flagellar protein FliT|nr:flagellar protein FliT [Serpentinimonas sp.]